MKIKNPVLDDLDLQILSMLMDNAKTPYTKVGEKLFVSAGTVHVRMKKLEEMGIVRRHRLEVDYQKLGYDVIVFIGIYLEKSSVYDKVVAALNDINEVVGLHYTTGVYSIFLKMVCKDTRHLKQVLHDKIQQINGIQRTETFISLDEGIDRPIKLIDK